LTLKQRVFAMCHEIAHAMFKHMARGKTYQERGFEGKPFIPPLYNHAADFVINDMLIQSNIGEFKQDWLHDQKFTADMLVEDVYRKLYDQAEKEGRIQHLQMPGQGQGQDGPGGNGRTDGQDTHIYSDTAKSDLQWKQAVEQAAAAAKAQGNLPGSIRKLIEQVMEPQVTWKEELRMSLNSVTTKDDTTWSRPNRRWLAMTGDYFPARVGYGAGDVAVVVDTSGSVSQKELQAFINEMSGILNDTHPENLWALSIDAKVHAAERLETEADLEHFYKETLSGGGGTDMTKGFDWAAEEAVPLDAMIILTDGYTPFGSDPGYPVIWVMSSDQQAPFGKNIRISV